ncbi:MAG: cytochrome c-type biogenesis protein CcmH [Candidatus Tokpelaia sp. JSC189]|nr:MAG: cytochrome c-type biogenesis protein CcmH [Candidatus Tokpelaia sp. JSC189]
MLSNACRNTGVTYWIPLTWVQILRTNRLFDGAMMLYCCLLLFTVVIIGLTLMWASRGYGCATEEFSNYRGQLLEIKDEKKQVLLNDESAEENRLELSGGIFAIECREKDADIAGNRRSFVFRLFLKGALLFIPFFSWGIYMLIGSPKVPSYPFFLLLEREPVGLDATEKLVRAEVMANRNPQNGRLVDELADLYLDMDRFQDAVNAYNHAIAMNGESVDRLLRYAIALTGFEEGVVSQQAEHLFLKITELDPQNPQAWIFLARGLLQNGKDTKAIKLLENFLETAPENAPWRQNLTDVVTELKQQILHQDENVIITLQQQQFIADNLDKLVARLENKPDNLQGWMMLINAWLVMGSSDEAELSLKKGLDLLSSDKARKLSAFAHEKGLTEKAVE